MGWKSFKPDGKDKTYLSQSAFAGYGLEERMQMVHCMYHNRRNPLSLDMGWKSVAI